MGYEKIKRILDLIIGIISLILISPILFLIMLLVKIKIGSPIFYFQERSGMNQRKFNIIKFRTMTDERDENGELLSDEQRLTVFGRWLRSTSLDELPELLSIVKGDMSFIGPRPLPVTYDAYYTSRELKRFTVRGGLIPPDSVDDNPNIPWDKQLEYEAEYAGNLSLKADLKILIAVFNILVKRKEIDYGAYVRKSLIEERNIDGNNKA